MNDARAPVSFDHEELILVDSADDVLGHATKAACHDGEGLLHRAFSIFILNGAGELLLQRRSAEKRLWPLFWSNSCCSHPRRGESMDVATARRLEQELSLRAPLRFLFRFEYHARFGGVGSERELCSVYVGRTDEPPRVHPSEVAAWKYVPVAELERELREHPERYTPWFRMEWERIVREHPREVGLA